MCAARGPRSLPVTFGAQRRAAGRLTQAGGRAHALKQGGHTTRDWPDKSDFADNAGRRYIASSAAILNKSPATDERFWLDFTLQPGGKRLDEEIPIDGTLPLTMPGTELQAEVNVVVRAYHVPGPKQRYGQVQVTGLDRATRLMLVARGRGGATAASSSEPKKKTKRPNKPPIPQQPLGGRVDK